MSSGVSTRPYRKQKRAEREEATRLRITEAAVELHRTLGPANTGIVDVAKRAGVSRTTVYSHFPTDVDMFTACSTHWASQNPFPDPGGWASVEDPSERLVVALKELYRWYADKEDMLGKVFRDLPIVPALETVMTGFWSAYVDAMVSTLAPGWSPRSDRAELEATLRLAVDFSTWGTLTRSGLDNDAAADLAARMIVKTFGP